MQPRNRPENSFVRIFRVVFIETRWPQDVIYEPFFTSFVFGLPRTLVIIQPISRALAQANRFTCIFSCASMAGQRVCCNIFYYGKRPSANIFFIFTTSWPVVLDFSKAAGH